MLNLLIMSDFEQGENRFKCTESAAIMAVITPDEFVAELIGSAIFEHDPESLRHTWPARRGGWAYMQGEITVGDETRPTSVSVYYPLKITRVLAQMFGREANANVKINLGNTALAPDEIPSLAYPPY